VDVDALLAELEAWRGTCQLAILWILLHPIKTNKYTLWNHQQQIISSIINRWVGVFDNSTKEHSEHSALLEELNSKTYNNKYYRLSLNEYPYQNTYITPPWTKKWTSQTMPTLHQTNMVGLYKLTWEGQSTHTAAAPSLWTIDLYECKLDMMFQISSKVDINHNEWWMKWYYKSITQASNGLPRCHAGEASISNRRTLCILPNICSFEGTLSKMHVS